MELELENGKMICLDESIDGVIARLYGEDGVLLDQRGFGKEFIYDMLFGGAE